MTKDPYTPKKRLIAHAKESIVTEEECYPVLITAAAVHIEQPILLGETKSFCKLLFFFYIQYFLLK
jgi:hypothetical protein